MSLKQEQGDVVHFPNLLGFHEIINEVNDMGFEAKLKSNIFNLQLHLETFSISNQNQLLQDLAAIPGVGNCYVDENLNTLVIPYNCDLLDSYSILVDCCHKWITPKANNDQNLQGLDNIAVLSVIGMTCKSCVKSIEGTLSELPAIQFIGVSLDNKQAVVQFDVSQITTAEIVENIEDMGFDATILQVC